MMPASFYRLIRRLLLNYAKSANPERLMQRSATSALKVATNAAKESAAYRTLLSEQGVRAGEIGQSAFLKDLPVLTKDNTFGRFSLDELARPTAVADIADVLTSSGRGGTVFGFKLATRQRHDASWFDIDLGLQDMFDVDGLATLVVNCLPMGVIFHSRAAAIANLSVREDMACAILRDVGPRFKQTLLCTDPLFIRQLIDQAQATGVDWQTLNTSVILGEEMLVEPQRDFIAKAMNIDLDAAQHRTIGSTYGMGELGLNLLFETRETIRIRRHKWRNRGPIASAPLADRAIPSVFCFNPLRCYPEILNPDSEGYGELVFTLLQPDAVVPLPRYSSGDLARLISTTEGKAMATEAGTTAPWLPMIALRGRAKDRSIAGRASVESIKEWLYTDHAIAHQLTGAFRLQHPTPHERQRLIVQASSRLTEPASALVTRLLEMLHPLDRASLTLEIVQPERFAWRPQLDYERKFSYSES